MHQQNELANLLDVILHSIDYPANIVDLAKKRVVAYLASPMVTYVSMEDGSVKTIIAEVK